MQCAWIEHNSLQLRDVQTSTLDNHNTARLKILCAGICGTDIQLLKGYYNFTGIPGHEFVAEVIDAPHHPAWLGKRVVADINISCGECTFCLQGMRKHCSKRKVIGILNHPGAFAETLCAPVQNLYTVPDTITTEYATFCEPVAAALDVLDKVHINHSQRVLLIGAGRLGQLIARVLSSASVNICVVTRHANQTQQLSLLGINCIHSNELSNDAQWDVVIDASGSPSGLNTALQVVRAGGTIILKSTTQAPQPYELSKLVVKEIQLRGSRCGDMAKALNWIHTHGDTLADLIEAKYPLANIDAALQHAQQPGCMKILISP